MDILLGVIVFASMVAISGGIIAACTYWGKRKRERAEYVTEADDEPMEQHKATVIDMQTGSEVIYTGRYPRGYAAWHVVFNTTFELNQREDSIQSCDKDTSQRVLC